MLCGLLAVSAQAWAQSALTLNITGIKGELKDNVAIYLQKFTEDEVSAGTRLHAALTQEAEKALQALGYYQSEIEVHPKPDNPLALTLHIKAGKPVLIDTVDIQLSGDAANDADFAALLQQQAPKRGAILHHGQYEGLKSALRNLALRKGYFDARFSLNRLEVAPELNQAFVRLHFDSGVRYRFGEVTFSGQQIDSARLQSLLPFAAGDAYLASQLGELNQALATTGWFSSILVEGNTEQISDFHLPVEVSLAPERRNIIETGIGYSTDVGARLKLNWLKPWLNSAGHSLRTDLALSEIEQSIEAAYKLPLQHSATDYYQLQLGVRNRDTEDTASRESNLVLERYWLLGNQWYRTASLRWLYEDFVQADQRDNISLIMPGISYNRSRQAGGAMPHSADRLALRVEVSDEAWGSGASFVRLRGRAGWIGSAGDNHRFVTRLDAGAILMEALRKLPPSLRFFAGGDNSIRGFGYETISPTNEQGELIGGRYLLTGSAEYQYRLRGNWWLAAFTDYGSAWDDNPDWQQGVGVGVRWASPVGPIRLDFAFGLDQPGSGFQLHFALGPEL
ncbi:outer membrane protein [Rheinheimera nanhaiensis E407-8]|uniref:Translocation and assembly module subunit TamA n=2 Tax=Rheinheimera TaxID=67575 RepID=I1DU11_9GAMM|nr:outer membrane protein [Rheinheimera nanhaiensis E407-8]